MLFFQIEILLERELVLGGLALVMLIADIAFVKSCWKTCRRADTTRTVLMGDTD